MVYMNSTPRQDGNGPVTVTVALYDGTRRAEADVDRNVLVSEILSMARSRWALDEGRDFRVVHTDRSGSTEGDPEARHVELDEDSSLHDSGVIDGSVLTVYPVLVAGAGALAAVRRLRLRTEAQALERLAVKFPQVLTVTSPRNASPPSRFEVAFRCPGIVEFGSGPKVSYGPHRVEIVYPEAFPSAGSVPHVRFLTPVRHLHVFPNGNVCLGALSGPDDPLDELVTRLLALIQHDPALLDF